MLLFVFHLAHILVVSQVSGKMLFNSRLSSLCSPLKGRSPRKIRGFCYFSSYMFIDLLSLSDVKLAGLGGAFCAVLESLWGVLASSSGIITRLDGMISSCRSLHLHLWCYMLHLRVLLDSGLRDLTRAEGQISRV